MSVTIKCERPFDKNSLKEIIERYDNVTIWLFDEFNDSQLNIFLVAVAVHQWIHNVHHALHHVRLNLFVAIHVLRHRVNWNQNLIVAHLCQFLACHVHLNLYLVFHALSFVHLVQTVSPVHLCRHQFQFLAPSSGPLLLLVDYFILEQSSVIPVCHLLVKSYLSFFTLQCKIHPSYICNYLTNKTLIII